MHPGLVRCSLGGGFDAETVFAALYAGHDDVFWLDGGPGGMSYLGSGVRADTAPGTVWELLRSVPGGPHLGVVGWLGYELRAQTTGAAVSRRSRYPDSGLLAVDRVIAIDGRTGAAELVARGSDWGGGLATWRDEVAGLSSVESAPSIQPVESTRPNLSIEPILRTVRDVVWHETDSDYLANVEACQSAILEGEAYQLCLTTEGEVAGDFDPVDVYRRLRASSPSHHGGLVRVGGISLVSASPERFLEIDPAGAVRTHPIKGTRPRADDPVEDARLAAELASSEKERAENLMIVDLMRNDLARVCELGTVAVTRLVQVESYAHVHQLVSTVAGQLQAGRSPIDAIEACFPAGSMTGAPKRRATEILDTLERRPRGLYAGAFGYVGFDGRVDLAVTIRSIVLDDRGATIGTGGGITALSNPADELAEAKLKAAALLAALGVG
jgi:anthranilate synthase component 1